MSSTISDEEWHESFTQIASNVWGDSPSFNRCCRTVGRDRMATPPWFVESVSDLRRGRGWSATSQPFSRSRLTQMESSSCQVSVSMKTSKRWERWSSTTSSTFWWRDLMLRRPKVRTREGRRACRGARGRELRNRWTIVSEDGGLLGYRWVNLTGIDRGLADSVIRGWLFGGGRKTPGRSILY